MMPETATNSVIVSAGINVVSAAMADPIAPGAGGCATGAGAGGAPGGGGATPPAGGTTCGRAPPPAAGGIRCTVVVASRKILMIYFLSARVSRLQNRSIVRAQKPRSRTTSDLSANSPGPKNTVSHRNELRRGVLASSPTWISL